MIDWLTDNILTPVFDGGAEILGDIGDFIFGPESYDEFYSTEDTFFPDINIGSFLGSSGPSELTGDWGSAPNKASAIAAQTSMKNRRDILQMKKLQGEKWSREAVKNRMTGLPMLPTDRAPDMREKSKNILNTIYANAMREGRGRKLADSYYAQLKKYGVDVNPYAGAQAITDPYSDVG
jgi:hypothetical protein